MIDGEMKTNPALRDNPAHAVADVPWLTALPAAQQSAVKQLFPLMATLTRESDALNAGNLMARVFESQLAARKQPAHKAGLAIALLRGRVAREEIKQEEGGSISSAEAAARLGISKTAVLKRYHHAQLLGWKEARQGAVRMPVWQFTEDNVLPGIPEVLTVLNQASWMDDWARVLFFLNRRSSLGDQRPLDLLRKGGDKRVLRAATAAIA